MFSTAPTFATEGATARFHVSGSNGFALGHYPGDPVFPGVMSLHLMQTLAEAFVNDQAAAPQRAAGFKRVSYLSLVRPGDVAIVECDPPKHSAATGQTVTKARLRVGDRLCVKSEFIFNPC